MISKQTNEVKFRWKSIRDLGGTYREVASRAGCSERYIGMCAAGDRKPSAALLLIAKKYYSELQALRAPLIQSSN